MGAVLIGFHRGDLLIIAPLKFYIKIRVNHTDNKQIPKNPDLDLKGTPEYLDGIKRDIKDSVKTVLSEI